MDTFRNQHPGNLQSAARKRRAGRGVSRETVEDLRIDGVNEEEEGADYGSRGIQSIDSDDKSKTAAAQGADGNLREGSDPTKSAFVRGEDIEGDSKGKDHK